MRRASPLLSPSRLDIIPLQRFSAPPAKSAVTVAESVSREAERMPLTVMVTVSADDPSGSCSSPLPPGTSGRQEPSGSEPAPGAA